MKKIQDYVDKIDEELCEAKEYAEMYLTFRASDSIFTAKAKEMAEDELKHAGYVHDIAVSEINDLKRVFTPPVEMQEAWDKSHKTYLEKAAWIRQMLNM